MTNISPQKTGRIGLLAVIIFLIALTIFGLLNINFNFLSSYISLLGAKGQPYAIWWNLIGFGLVGVLLAFFGYGYGKVLNDKLIQILLPLFGLGFAFTGLPMDMIDDRSPVSKAHIVAICLGLACWLFSLSRFNYLQTISKKIKKRAAIAAILLVCSISGSVLNLWPMPVTHRLVFAVVFGWTFISALELRANGQVLAKK